MSIRIASVAAIAALAITPQIASAGSSVTEALSACTTAVQTELPLAAEDVSVSFKRVKGSSRVKTLKLKVRAGEETGTATCKVKRDEAPVVTFDKDLEAYRVELVQRATKTASGAN